MEYIVVQLDGNKTPICITPLNYDRTVFFLCVTSQGFATFDLLLYLSSDLDSHILLPNFPSNLNDKFQLVRS